MPFNYTVPGVYREEEFQKPQLVMPTGVAGFVGFVAKAKLDDNKNPLAVTSKPTVLYHQEDFDFYFEKQSGSYLADAVNGFFQNGGTCCYVSCAQESSNLLDAVEALAPFSDIDLIAVPDAVNLEEADFIAFFQGLLNHCAQMGDRFAVFDFPKYINTTASAEAYWKQLITNMSEARSFGALYFPWLQVEKYRQVPPCGHIAGIFARSDAKTGFFKAPANEEIFGVFDLASEVNIADQEKLNPLGINCIRAMPGRGIRLMGARTLSDETEWRYINVRRLVITLRRWIDENMGWAVFEPNNHNLWTRIKRELDTYLHGLWLRGALQGNTAEQAYFIKCDDETNPPYNRENGGLITEIGLAPIVPAEFVVVHIVHRQQLSTETGGNA